MSEADKDADSKKSSEARVRLSAKDLTVRFGPVVALNGFTANIPEGVIGLLGPNGAGKSTLIKASLGLVTIHRGAISVGGLDSQTQSLRIRDDIGYMPEHDCLLPSMSSVELVSYMGQVSGMDGKDAMQRTHEVLDFVGIGEERYRLIKSYSTGMKQKVKLAQAIVHDPALLFLDEPTSGMDPNGREEMLDLVRRIGEAKKTIIVSSHILQEVERVCEHAVIISEGRLVRDGKMGTLMAGEEGLQNITVRGDAKALAEFSKALGAAFEVVRKAEEGAGQMAISVKLFGDGKKVFALARAHGVQVRSYVPDKMSLEDVYLQAFRGGGPDGH